MLSLVSGPTPIVVKVVSDAAAQTLRAVSAVGLWVEGLGLVVQSGPGSTRVDCPHIVNIDGTAYYVSGYFSGTKALRGYGWDDALEQAWADWGVFTTTARVRLPPFHIEEIRGGNAYGTSTAMLADRRIYFSGGRIYANTYAAGNWSVPTSEYFFAGGGAGGGIIAKANAPASLVGHSVWWCLDVTSGAVYLYDATAKTELLAYRTSLGSAFVTGGYSRKHDLFFVIRANAGTGAHELSIYANEPTAASIAAPTFAFPPRRGRPVQATTRVLGAQGEPCAGRHVAWGVTVGRVEPEVVETDESGYARTLYYPPTTVQASVDITATMLE